MSAMAQTRDRWKMGVEARALVLLTAVLLAFGLAVLYSASAIAALNENHGSTYDLARQLTELSFADRVLYSNSGAEANEAALKFARRWAGRQAAPGRTGLVAFEGGFHGRSLGALSLTAKARYREPFAPLVPGTS